MTATWARRAASLYGELAALTEVGDPRWWLLAGGVAVAEPWAPRVTYVASDAEPGADTFLGVRTPAPPTGELARHAIVRAHAARAAVRALDGELPEQPLAVAIRRGANGAILEPSALDRVAFAIGGMCWWATLAEDVAAEAALIAELEAEIVAASAGELREPNASARLRTPGDGATPFATIALGSEPIATARHGHRRGWTAGAQARGPWLGLSRTHCGLAIVSTCHLVVDGYGHAWLCARIAEHVAALASRATALPAALPSSGAPPLALVDAAIPLGIAWRELPTPSPRALPLAYALGTLLHTAAGSPTARFSPTMQIPVAPGERGDPTRVRRRPIAAVASVRFADGVAEPFAAFEARTRDILAREADGRGLCSRLLAAARAAPAPIAWKRRAVSAAARPRWLDRFSAVIGGRACVSRIRLADASLPPMCAVSSPARMASPLDPFGACVVTVIDDGTRAAITVCGSGLAGTAGDANALIDAILASC